MREKYKDPETEAKLREGQQILTDVIAQNYTPNDLRVKINQNSLETLLEFVKRMRVVERMQSAAFRHDNPKIQPPQFRTFEQLAGVQDREVVLNVLATYLSTM